MKIIPIKIANDISGLESGSSVTCANSALVAMQVLDDSMAPELSCGHVVTIDNSAKIYDGALVLALFNDEHFIRRWQEHSDDRVKLVALNPSWDTQLCRKNDVEIMGVVVQRAGRRRHERRHYRPLQNTEGK